MFFVQIIMQNLMINESYVNILSQIFSTFPQKILAGYISTFFDKIVNSKDDDTYDIILHNV